MTIWESDKKHKKKKKREERQKIKGDDRYQETRYVTKQNEESDSFDNELLPNTNADEYGNILPVNQFVDIYNILPGDRLWQVVRTKLPSKTESEINLKVKEIVDLNKIPTPDFIAPGSILQVPLTPKEWEEYHFADSPKSTLPEGAEKGVAYVSIADPSGQGEYLDNILKRYLPGLQLDELIAKREEIVCNYPELDPSKKLMAEQNLIRIYIPLNNEKEKRAYKQGNNIHNLAVVLPSGSELPNADLSVSSISKMGGENNSQIIALNIGAMPEDQVKKIINEEKPAIWHLISHGESGGLMTSASGDGDGKIVNEEITKLAFQGAELVFMDACKSAVYDVANNTSNSVQSSAMLAGAQESVGMNWNVDDTLARLFSDEFYKRRMADPEKETWEIVRELQLELKEKYFYPTYWAIYNVLSVHYKKDDYSVTAAYSGVLDNVNTINEIMNDDLIKSRNHLAAKDPEFNRMWSKYKEYELLDDKSSEDDKYIIQRKKTYLLSSIQLYEKLHEVSVPKDLLKEKTKQLNKTEATVEIKYIPNDKVYYNQYVAFVTTAKNTQPKIFFLGDGANKLAALHAINIHSSRIEDKTASYEMSNKGSIMIEGSEVDLYNSLWKNVQQELDKEGITKVYLSTEGAFKNVNINSLLDAEGKYVIDKIAIINLY